MSEQLKRGGWIYVLHHEDEAGLAREIKLGLNRLGHQIWVRERDSPDEDDWEAHSRGVSAAGFVVVLETAALANWTFAEELLERAETPLVRKPRMIGVEVEPGHRTCGATPIKMRALPRRLVADIDADIRKRSKRAVRPAAPVGRRGRYVLLSYASPDADKAVEVRMSLADLGIEAWDYGVSPRQPSVEFEREIPAAIEKATAVLFVFTKAWSDSSYCRGEMDHARASGRRCLWLCFGPGSPPVEDEKAERISFRGPGGRASGLSRLADALGPS